MGILDQFDPQHDGWQFENWREDSPDLGDLSWDLYRRTYLAINPSNDPVAAPLDVAFYQVFKGCAGGGNCGGMSMLALAMFKHGGFMGWCSPPDFYLPANMADHKRPARTDLHEAIGAKAGAEDVRFGHPHKIRVVGPITTGALHTELCR